MGTGRDILIVDDNEVVCGVLVELFQKEGYDSWSAASGEECLEELRQVACKLIMLDVRLPGISGIEVLRAVRRDHPGLDVIIMTSHAPWKLHDAELVALRSTMLEAQGLPTPAGAPMVHYSERQEVSIWPLKKIR